MDDFTGKVKDWLIRWTEIPEEYSISKTGLLMKVKQLTTISRINIF